MKRVGCSAKIKLNLFVLENKVLFPRLPSFLKNNAKDIRVSADKITGISLVCSIVYDKKKDKSTVLLPPGEIVR